MLLAQFYFVFQDRTLSNWFTITRFEKQTGRSERRAYSSTPSHRCSFPHRGGRSEVDPFYTPPEIAEMMVQQVRHLEITYIADFAAGDGGLLRAAVKQWPDARIFAADLDPSVVAKLRRRHPDWTIGQCDFLAANSRLRCRAISGLTQKCSLVLLNPPFSYRGGEFWTTQIGDETVRCSQAVAFLASALRMVRRAGQIVAIVPAGSLTSERDRKAWAVLRQVACVEVLSQHGRRTFDGCFPRTALVRVSPLAKKVATAASLVAHLSDVAANGNGHVARPSIEIVRGWVQMHSLELRSGPVLPLIHSKDLTDARAEIGDRRARSVWQVSGPAVLIPRVGQPSRDNVCFYLSKRPIALSDCVIAITTATIAEARQLHSVVIDRWRILEAGYGGTCARYITIETLRQALRRLGFDA
jgi:predicted RNA methylase